MSVHGQLDLSDGRAQSDEDRPRDDRVADVELAHTLDRGDRANIGRIQPMASIDLHAARLDRSCGLRDLGQFDNGARSIGCLVARAAVTRVRVGTRVNLAAIKACAGGRLDLLFIGVNERTHGNSRLFQPRHGHSDALHLGTNIKAALGGDFLPSFGHKHGQVRLEGDGDGDHLFGRSHLEVEPSADNFLDAQEVGVLNVPTILPQVHGDAVGAARLGLDRGVHRIRLMPTPRLADRRNMVDVHAEFRHRWRFLVGGSWQRAPRGAAYAPQVYSPTVPNFNDQLAHLRNDIVAQGDRVLDITLKAVESYFDGDRVKAALVIAADEEVDRVDVEIERASIPLLAMGVTDEKSIRSVLTIVKVNNELERVADCAVDIAEAVLSDVQLPARIPDVFRVMANSVIGMLRDTNRALAAGNTSLAQQVLLFDDTVASFRTQLLRTAQEQVAAGALPVDYAFRLLTITKSIERIADHCTNVCEQVIYLHAGLIVRHRPEGWSKPLPPSP